MTSLLLWFGGLSYLARCTFEMGLGYLFFCELGVFY
jgi:hypothetical protein